MMFQFADTNADLGGLFSTMCTTLTQYMVTALGYLFPVAAIFIGVSLMLGLFKWLAAKF